ncbi:MAG: PrsW family intramembrane metalloprotease [Candidatus Aminicenantes bacterium]|nr:PrsW family intramembrane metalloprotease [Candidatus Aminicenantes bacterium]
MSRPELTAGGGWATVAPRMLEDAVIINAVLNVGLIALIFTLDRHERESAVELAKVFFLSITATFLLTFTKSLTMESVVLSPAVSAYVEAGFFEELLKFGILAWVIARLRICDESFDLVVYMGTIALGFAFFENVNYYLRITAPGTLWRTLTADASLYNTQLATAVAARLTPVHLLIDLTAVFLIGRGDRVRWARVAAAFAVAVVLHGTWNILADAIWIIPYTFILTVLATTSIVLLSARSAFHRWGADCEALVDNNVFLVRSLGQDWDEEDRSKVVEALHRVREGLGRVRFMGGREQRTFFRFFRETFPSPLLPRGRAGLAEGLERLGRILRRLEPLAEARTDWTYYAGLAIALVFAAALALGLSVAVAYLL